MKRDQLTPLALLVTLIPLAIAMIAWRQHPSHRKLALKGREGGKLELRQTVIEKIVRQSVAELPEIEKIRVSAVSSRGGLRVKIHVRARDVRSVPDLDEAIRIRADQSLRRILGIEEIQTVDVSLEDMSSFERSSPGVGEFRAQPFPPAGTPLYADDRDRPKSVFVSSEDAPAKPDSVVLRPDSGDDDVDLDNTNQEHKI